MVFLGRYNIMTLVVAGNYKEFQGYMNHKVSEGASRKDYTYVNTVEQLLGLPTGTRMEIIGLAHIQPEFGNILDVARAKGFDIQ
jgi:hypothetical protein